MNVTLIGQRLLRNRLVRLAIRPWLPVHPRDDLERLGSDYGGWWVPVSLLGPNSVVYSLGIGGDATFDLAVMHRFGCKLFGFDPTPFSLDYVASRSWPEQWNFEPIGIWTHPGVLSFTPAAGQTSGSSSITRAGNDAAAFQAPVEPLHMVLHRLGHETIDLLKMDIEGAEGPVIDQMLEGKCRPMVLCIEYDQPELPWRLVARIRQLVDAGYDIVKIEGWNFTFVLKAKAATPISGE